MIEDDEWREKFIKEETGRTVEQEKKIEERKINITNKEEQKEEQKNVLYLF